MDGELIQPDDKHNGLTSPIFTRAGGSASARALHDHAGPDVARTERRRAISVLELRAADGPGGGPEKTILRGAALSDPDEFKIHVVYLRDQHDTCAEMRRKAAALGVRYSEVRTRGPVDTSVIRKIRSLVRTLEIDIIHAHDYKSNFIAFLMQRYANFGILSTAHGWTGNLRRERYLYYPIDRAILKRFPKIVSVSSQITERLVKTGIDVRRIATFPNGIDVREFCTNPALRAASREYFGVAPDTFVIGAVGRLERQKRFDLLLEAFRRFCNEFPESVLLIAGEGTLKEDLDRQIAALGLVNRCRLVGHICDVRSFYQALDLFAQSSDYEGTPNVVLEAMALNVPVIATSAGGTCDVVRNKHDGLVVQCGEADALAVAMREVRCDKQATQVRVANARRRVETELSFESRNRKLENVYRSLVGPSGQQDMPVLVGSS